MEDGVNGSSKKASTADKVGWLKKSSGGLLGNWKDRYILLYRAQILVYENEDEQNCLETVELENYDRCQDLHALLKRKNRFILIRSPGKKVQDIKFQAKNLEEKQAWIKFFSEGINKGKNKIFDEVKVDASCSLDHVTRDRAKMGQGRRRPPTRLHLKEVADGASDGIMRLDLDMVDNGPQSIIPDTGEKETSPTPKENYKPPMPPSKPSLPPSVEEAEDETSADNSTPSEALSPPPKVLKERTASEGSLELTAEVQLSNTQEDLTKDPTKHVAKPPMPPPKVLSDKMKVKWDEPSPEYKGSDVPETLASSKENLVKAVEKEASKPPIPPPKILTGNMKSNNEGLCTSRSSLEVIDHDAEDLGRSQLGAQVSFSAVENTEIQDSPFTEEDKEADGEKLLQTQKEMGELDKRPNRKAIDIKHGMAPSPGAKGLPISKSRCSSVGDLLSNDSTDLSIGGPLKNDRLEEMEIRLSSGREKTELLLQQVLQGKMGENSEGNGPKPNAEMLLSEAVEQLRQASQVLQEMKDLGQSTEPDAPSQREMKKSLKAMHRRSIP
ncbi:pleckstrin homology domain-containing family O member 2 [Ambystoma mexicanum]|uniref:pleckstrin homology domain-containing family O member 2 n=1 Tax=Ambystoma mexicanum TaxID=8296 RepID=UPI0037E98900